MKILKKIKLDDKNINKIKTIFDKKSLYITLVKLNEFHHIDAMIQSSIEYNLFFDEMTLLLKNEIYDKEFNMSIDFDNKELICYLQ